MKSTHLFWIPGPWPGKLAIAARPRGEDWLNDEMKGWRDEGVNTILSLLTVQEENELSLDAEPESANEAGLRFLSFPIPDRQVPGSPSQVAPLLDGLSHDLMEGQNVVIHCRGGVGRSGLMAACLLVLSGDDPETAVATVSHARGTTVPETPEQRHWIDLFAANLANAK